MHRNTVCSVENTKGGRKYLFIQAFYLDENEYSVVADIIDVSKMTERILRVLFAGIITALNTWSRNTKQHLKTGLARCEMCV